MAERSAAVAAAPVDVDAPAHEAPPTRPARSAAETVRRAGAGPLAAAARMSARYGLVIALLATVTTFGLLRPTTFLTLDNATSVLTLAAPLAVAALGLTVVLAMGDFDLSVGSMIGLGGAVAIVLMVGAHLAWPAALAAALAAGAAAGGVSGLLVAYGGASSFIVTLGMGTVLVGFEFLLTGQKTIYGDVAPGYTALGQSLLLGVNLQVWIAAAATVVVYLLLSHTEAGRYMYAVGANPEAARLAGIRTRGLRLTGFVVAGIGAALAGVLLTAQAASSFSNSGQTYLLPAFAAAFLGSTVFRPGQFNPLGTVVGVLFLGIIQTGLTMLALSTAVVDLVQGGVLVAAILLSRLGRRR